MDLFHLNVYISVCLFVCGFHSTQMIQLLSQNITTSFSTSRICFSAVLKSLQALKRLYADVLLSVVVFNQEASLLYTRFCFYLHPIYEYEWSFNEIFIQCWLRFEWHWVETHWMCWCLFHEMYTCKYRKYIIYKVQFSSPNAIIFSN